MKRYVHVDYSIRINPKSNPQKREYNDYRSPHSFITAAIIRIAKANRVEWVGSDAAEIFVKKAEEYIGNLAKEAENLAYHV